MTPAAAAPGPLSRRLDVAAVREGGTPVRFEATGPERDALAQAWALPGVEALAADLLVRREGGGGLRVTGTVTARVQQVCVVSLDAFAADLSEPVDVAFAPEAEVEALAAARASRASSAPDDEADDLPDPITGGRIDLGALAAELVALGLDPYPRKPGAAFAEPAPPAPEPDASPFAALRQLRDGG